MILATLIKDHREKNGWTIRAMAAKIGVQYDALCRFEQGKPIQIRHWVAVLRWVLTT